MNARLLASVLLVSAFAMLNAGCDRAPGKPKPGLASEEIRPDQVTDFATLYSQNCAACHGDHGKNGAAISLADPLYLAFAGAQNLQRITAAGVPGTMMPGFQKSAGGMLTEQQITILTQGMIQAWGNASVANGQNDPSLPSYTSSLHADSTQGQKAFGAHCATCHGADAAGTSSKGVLGSLVDPAYLALISDQGLRTSLITGKPDAAKPDQAMPDYRSYPGHALTDQEITDIVAWLASHRTATPGQIYRQHQ
jgi:mono/diheme cytochrome c family protein